MIIKSSFYGQINETLKSVMDPGELVSDPKSRSGRAAGYPASRRQSVAVADALSVQDHRLRLHEKTLSDRLQLLKK